MKWGGYDMDMFPVYFFGCLILTVPIVVGVGIGIALACAFGCR